MRYNICSISFRHELVSFRDLVQFAHQTGFDGIELWGVHAVSLVRNSPYEAVRIVKEMQHTGIHVSMLSHYLDMLAESERFTETEKQWRELIRLARLFQTDKIRIFAGNKASADATEKEWELCVSRLRHIARLSAEYGIYTVIETHPGTLADCLDSTLRLVGETNHEYLSINLDFLHMWESGCEPLEAYRRLKPWIINYHLKNVREHGLLQMFSPDNVYSPNGQRDGMVPLADGVIDYSSIILMLNEENTPHSASFEWFGNEPFKLLKAERKWLKQYENQSVETVQV